MSAFGESAIDLAKEMDRTGELAFRGGLFVYPSFEPPAPKVGIRGTGGDTVRLLIDGVELGDMEYWRALRAAHAGAVYLHRGQSYLVVELDLDNKLARLSREDVPFYTQPIVQSVIEPRVLIAEDEGRQVNLLGV